MARQRNGKNVKGDGQTLNGFNRRTDIRNRCLKCDGGHTWAPTCTLENKSGRGCVPCPPCLMEKFLDLPTLQYRWNHHVVCRMIGPPCKRRYRAMRRKSAIFNHLRPGGSVSSQGWGQCGCPGYWRRGQFGEFSVGGKA